MKETAAIDAVLRSVTSELYDATWYKMHSRVWWYADTTMWDGLTDQVWGNVIRLIRNEA
jgi:hypothetical protein